MKRFGFALAVCLVLPLTLSLLPFPSAAAAVPDGYIVKVETPTVYLDWGASSGVHEGDRFQVYRAGAELKHPVTGEVLGHEEQTLGAGTIDRIEDKFSVGHLEASAPAVQTGDRTRWEQASLTVIPPAAAVAESSTPATGAVLRELWRSPALPDEAVSLTIAHLKADGPAYVVVAFTHKIQAFLWKDNQLTPVATFEDKHYGHWLEVDAADLKGDGQDELFATAFSDGLQRPQGIVLRFVDGALKIVGDFSGVVRALDRKDGKRHLYGQSLSPARELNFSAISEIAWDKTKYRWGPPLRPALFGDQLMGFAWGAWGGDLPEDFAVLERGDWLRLYLKDTKWKAKQAYGGTKNVFPRGGQVGTLAPRLFSWHPAHAAKDLLIVPHNIQDFGINLTSLKIYKNSELYALAWNGLDMEPVWHLPVDGYLADYTLGDGLQQGASQLWIAAVGPGDKTVLLTYTLPQ